MAFLSWVLGTPLNRLILLVTADVAIFAASVSLSFLVRIEDVPVARALPLYLFIVAIRIPLLLFTRSYSVSLIYTSLRDMTRILAWMALSSLLALGAVLLARSQALEYGGSVPLGVVAIEYAFACILMSGWRLSRRLIRMARSKQTGKRTLVIGAGGAAEQILRSILETKGFDGFPVALLDDDPKKQNTTIHGIRVVGTTKDIAEIARKYHINAVVIAIPSAPTRVIRAWFDDCRNAGVPEILILPSISEILSGEVSVRDIRRVSLQDLLGRDVVQVDSSAIQQLLTGKPVMVTGAAGSIGSELCRQVAFMNPSVLYLLDQDETGLFHIEQELRTKLPSLSLLPLVADVTNTLRLKTLFAESRPAVVFHAAAYKHVPMMEGNPDEAVRNNVIGTLTVARAAMEAGVERFVFISTDKAVEPVSIMGKTKRVGELMMAELSKERRTRFMSVRFGNVMGSRGSVIESFQKMIQSGGPVTVTHPEMERYFMLTSEAVLLVLQAAALGEGGETFILDMGQPIKIMELATEMIRLAGLEPNKDVEVRITGVRPGEKLTEKLHFDDENLTPTRHKKISLARNGGTVEGVLAAVDGFAVGKTRMKAADLLDALVALKPVSVSDAR